MTRRRWIADEISGDRAALVGEHARHLAQVLRAQVGQEFDISTGTEVRRGTILTIDPERVEFVLGELLTGADRSEITVALSIFKFDRMEWAIEKCTELGVARVIPLISARSEPHLAQAAQKRVERWRRIAKQAAEQSRQTSAPEIGDPIKFNELAATTIETRILLSEVENELKLKDAVPAQSRSLLLAFGPEGGWKEEELTAFQKQGWISASLGNTVLRTETAVIAAVAIVMSVLA